MRRRSLTAIVFPSDNEKKDAVLQKQLWASFSFKLTIL
jgi:hypothetical protein